MHRFNLKNLKNFRHIRAKKLRKQCKDKYVDMKPRVGNFLLNTSSVYSPNLPSRLHRTNLVVVKAEKTFFPTNL